MVNFRHASIITILILTVEASFIASDDFNGQIVSSQFQPETLTYRQMIKRENMNAITSHNMKPQSHRAFTLHPYPEFINYRIDEIYEIYMNKDMSSFWYNNQRVVVRPTKERFQMLTKDSHSNYKQTLNLTYLTGSVKNQGKCGGCYAFSGNSVINYHFNKYYDNSANIYEASEQEILQCSQGYKNKGCQGGWPHYAFNYTKTNGSVFNQRYQYRGQTVYGGTIKSCEVSQNTIKNINIKQSKIVASLDNGIETIINILKLHGPISVGVVGTDRNFIFYKYGVLDDCGDGYAINHAVNIVGYVFDTDNEQHFWIVKNSWGKKWGINGHIHIEMDYNTCSIQTYAAYLKTSQ